MTTCNSYRTLQVGLGCLLWFANSGLILHAQNERFGQFESSSDIGQVGKAGKLELNRETSTYAISGGGANMWFAEDELHYVWTKVSGDLSIAADIHWPSAEGNAHRKACLIIRQSLETNAAYADAALHGDGLCSIQYRETAGDATHEIQSNVSAPKRVQLEKRGNYVSISLGEDASHMRSAGGIFRIAFEEPFYVGLGVCAHDDERIETAVFSNVTLKRALTSVPTDKVRATLETISIGSTDRRVVYHTGDLIEAPNWLPSGQTLLFNSRGSIYSIPVTGGEPAKIDTGMAIRNNNDHGVSADGTTLAISDQTRPGGSRIYTLPIGGGTPRLITEAAPSYWHGWSPDGKLLSYCAQRDGNYDIYIVPSAGGAEKRLTEAPGLDDGPEFAPDGQKIYFNSDRSGSMQVWSMNVDGSQQQPLTRDEFHNWFPHPSPDGRWLVFLSYQGDVPGHPPNKDVMLRLMPREGGETRVLAKLYGGQGTINVPSWSPDSRSLAFVSYQPVFE